MTERPSAFAVDRRGFIRLAGATAAGWLALGDVGSHADRRFADRIAAPS